MKNKILVACEESQAVTIELRKLGLQAFSCDMLPCSGGHPEWHLQCDVSEIINDTWGMILAFPPCTHLAVSGAAHFLKKRNDGRQKQAICFFMQFLNSNCKLIAVENPVGIISGKYILKHFPNISKQFGLPIKPSQIIQPYYFGDKANKKTCLWLKGLPNLTHLPKNYSHGSKYITSKSGKRYPDWCWYSGGGSGKKRSKTYPGVAKAMATQWGHFFKCFYNQK